MKQGAQIVFLGLARRKKFSAQKAEKEIRMIYFDNAATGGKKPDSVIRAVTASLQGYCANPGRSGHALSLAAAQDVLRTRKLLQKFFNAPDCERVILTKNCTEALNEAIFGLFRHKNAATSPQKPHIVSTVAEHNSVLRPLFYLDREGLAEITLVPLKRGKILPSAIASAVRENTIAAVFTLASNVTGTGIDPSAVRALLPERVLMLCDGAQAGGHIPIDMKASGIDALCLAGHKGLHGIQGSGALLLSERYSPAPFQFGGTGSESFNPDMPDFYPDRLEAGTVSCPAAASLAEGILYLTAKLPALGARLEKMTGTLIRGLKQIPNIRVFSAANPFGIVAFSSDTLQSEFFAQRLSDDYDIVVRGGLHCAPRMHEALGSRDGLVRASLSEFNTEAEIGIFLDAVREIAADSSPLF